MEIDNIPDGIEILTGSRSVNRGTGYKYKTGTHVSLYVEILQVESVFPYVNADDGGVREERVLVGCGDNLELPGAMVIALMDP